MNNISWISKPNWDRKDVCLHFFHDHLSPPLLDHHVLYGDVANPPIYDVLGQCAPAYIILLCSRQGAIVIEIHYRKIEDRHFQVVVFAYYNTIPVFSEIFVSCEVYQVLRSVLRSVIGPIVRRWLALLVIVSAEI